MGAIKAGVVCVTKFCKAHSSQFESYIDYIDRDEATRNDNSMKYNLYQDYMGNPKKTSSLFTEYSNTLNQEEKHQLKEVFQTAQDNGSLMWQTVISFDNRWLAENGLYRQEEQMLDEDRLKGIIRSAVGKMLKAEKLENAVWSAAIHFNTDNIHVHIATVEPDPMREKREYIQYEEKMVDGKKVKEPIRDSSGQIVKKEEYKGTFKPKSIELCKSSVVNEILNERESNLKINQIIRESIVKQKKEHPLSKDKDLADAFLRLYEHMPSCAKNMWNYNNPIMAPVRENIDQLSNLYLEMYHKEELEELKTRMQMQEEKYKEAYGDSGKSYAAGKMQDLYSRLGNAILKEVREYDKEIKEGATNGTRINKRSIAVAEEMLGATNGTVDSLKDDKKSIGTIAGATNGTQDFLEDVRGISSMDTGATNGTLDPMERLQELYESAFDQFLAMEKKSPSDNIEFRLGTMYEKGLGTEADMESAEYYYSLAADAGNVFALNKMAGIYLKSGEMEKVELALDYLTRAAIEGKSDMAAYNMGKVYESEEYGVHDMEKAVSWYQAAEKAGNEFASYRLGRIDYKESNYGDAIKHFEKCNDNEFAYYSLAKIYLDQETGMYDLEKGIGYLEKASELNHSFSQYRLGTIYESEEYGVHDLEKAKSWYEKAEENGNELAGYRLGEIYYRESNYPEAVQHYEKAAELNHSLAQYRLGTMYESEEYGLQDIEKARIWYQAAEENENEFASYRLGKMYYQDKNYVAAVGHLERCDQEYSNYLLGKIFLDPDSGMTDPEKGIFYMTKSADAGNSYAELSLGILYLKGEVVDRDLEEARKWLISSAGHGNEYAQNILDTPPAQKYQNIRSGVSLASALNRMKKGLKNEWQKRQNIREHEQLMEQGKNQTLDQSIEQ